VVDKLITKVDEDDYVIVYKILFESPVSKDELDKTLEQIGDSKKMLITPIICGLIVKVLK